MARGIRIPFIADVSSFIRGTRDVERSLDDVGDSLDEFARDSERATEKAERSFRELQTAARKAGTETGDALRNGSRAGMADAGREAGAEFTQNFAEGVKAGDPAGVLVETIANAGGIFGAAGLAVAGLFGIGAALVADVAEQAERLREAGRTAWEALRDGMLDAAEQKVQLTAALGVDTLEEALDKVARLAGDTGLAAADIAAYIANGVDPAGKVAAALQAAADAEARAKATRDGSWQSLSREETAALSIATARERNVTALERGNDLLRIEAAITDGITNSLRIQQELRWADPTYGAAYARSAEGRYRQP
jgi:hypothetical protein